MNRDKSADDTDTDEAVEQHRRAFDVLNTATAHDMDLLVREIKGFPQGVDLVVGRRWIINAIDSGSAESVLWILNHGVDLDFVDEEGSTPILSMLDREKEDRLELLEVLLQAGAPINRKGNNDWTPAHRAAYMDDVDALQVLVRHGADLSIRTNIDDYATPLEEARNHGQRNAVKYLESLDKPTQKLKKSRRSKKSKVSKIR